MTTTTTSQRATLAYHHAATWAWHDYTPSTLARERAIAQAQLGGRQLKCDSAQPRCHVGGDHSYGSAPRNARPARSTHLIQQSVFTGRQSRPTCHARCYTTPTRKDAIELFACACGRVLCCGCTAALACGPLSLLPVVSPLGNFGQSERISFFRCLLIIILIICLLYTSPSPRDLSTSRMPSSA